MFATSDPFPPTGPPPACVCDFAGASSLGAAVGVACLAVGTGFAFGATGAVFSAGFGAGFGGVGAGFSTGVGATSGFTAPMVGAPAGAAISRTAKTGADECEGVPRISKNAAMSPPWSTTDASAPPVSRGAVAVCTLPLLLWQRDQADI